MKALPYIKLEYGETINAKREILSSQADILKTLKTIQNYKKIRNSELIKKSNLRMALNSLNKQIKKLLKELPETESISEPETKSLYEISRSKSIDSELREIQRKLAELEKE